ncbi:MAG: HAMP domain-containing protein [Spirochaetes bacterium]|nr:HAMP domain-containing protein [Spirochaetota bacterium]
MLPIRFMPVSFRGRIILVFSILIVAFLGVMISLEIVGIPGTPMKGKYASYRAGILNDMVIVSGLLNQRIESWFNERRIDISGLATSPMRRRMIESVGADADRVLDDELAEFLKWNPKIDSIAIIDADRVSIRAVRGGFYGARNIGDIGIAADRFRRLIIPGYLEAVDVYRPADMTPHIRIIRQVTSTDGQNRIIGIIVAEMDIENMLRHIETALNDITSRKWTFVLACAIDGAVTLFREQGAVTGPGRETVPVTAVFTPIRMALSGINGPYDGPDNKGRPVLAFHRQIRLDLNVALAIVLSMDRTKALAPAGEEILRQSILWIVMLLSGIALIFLLARQITRPINELSDAARRVAAGDLTVHIETSGESEIGELAIVFNNMVSRLQQLHQDLEREVIARTRELQTLAKRQEAILSAIPDIIAEVDNNKVFTWSNNAGFEFYGPDLIGKEASYFFEGEQPTYDVVAPLFRGSEKVIYVESWQRRRDGEKRLLAWWCNSLVDDAGAVTGAISTARDITDQRNTEKALLQADKLSTLGILSTGIAHEINQPMMAISMALENIALRHGDAAYVLDKVAGMSAYVQRVKTIIEGIKTFARDHEAAPGSSFSVNEGIGNVINLVGTQYRLHEITLSLSLDETIPPVSGDLYRFEQVVLNLISNAKYAVDHRTLPAGTEFRKEISIATSHEGAHVVMRIRDNGTGMNEDVARKIFSPFFSTKPIGEGTGMGLSISYGIIKSMGGDITAESVPGSYTVLTVTLPAVT